METTILTVPGMGGSGSDHWQTLWEQADPRFRRVEQRDWDQPVMFEWVMTLEQALRDLEGPGVLVGHSLGCLVIVEAAANHPGDIVGALLVAPPDLDRMEGAGQTPMSTLPFPSIVVTSENDPWVSAERAEEFGFAWGSRFVNIGPAGHINADSGYGTWPEGRQLLDNLPESAFQ